MTVQLVSRRAVSLAVPALCLATSAAAAGDQLIFAEDFRDFSASAHGFGRWRTQLGGAGGVRALSSRAQLQNGDQQVYVDKGMVGATGTDPLGLDPFVAGPDGLEIIASPTPAPLLSRLWNQPFTSGLITTRFSFSTRYGRFRIEAGMPSVVGARASFWLTPRDPRASAHISIATATGLTPEVYHVGIGSQNSAAVQTSQRSVPMSGPHGALRSYGIDWGPDRITWLMDEVEVAAVATPSDLQSPMFLLIGLSVGDRWSGVPDPVGFDARLRIKRIAVSSWPVGLGFLTTSPTPFRLAEERSR